MEDKSLKDERRDEIERQPQENSKMVSVVVTSFS